MFGYHYALGMSLIQKGNIEFWFESNSNHNKSGPAQVGAISKAQNSKKT